MRDHTPKRYTAFLMHGSNWRFKAVEQLDINTVAYRPLKGSSYILLPQKLANKKVIINMNKIMFMRTRSLSNASLCKVAYNNDSNQPFPGINEQL